MSTAEKLQPAVQIKLKVLKGPHEGQSFHLAKSSFTVGRGPENEVVLINDPQISRQHARLQVVGQDIEIINLSKKNKVMVGSEEIQKWKLINDSTFMLGDTEIQIAFEIEKLTPMTPGPQLVRTDLPAVPVGLDLNPPPAPAAVPQAKKAPSMTPLQPQAPRKRPLPPPANRQQVPANRQGQVQARGPMQPGRPGPQGQMMPRPNQQMGPQFIPEMGMGAPRSAATSQANSGGGLLANPKARFYLIVGAMVLGLVYWLNMEEPKKPQSNEIKSTLKYEDEYLLKQNSVAEKELDQKRKAKLEQKNSPTNLRVEENFQKGMRDYQLGNYTRALDFFQVVLNLDASHVMARRHLYLAKIRFDEIVKAKLALGESYYQKHNFKMCKAMYQQVLIMLQGKNNDQSYQTAQSMSEKCGLAAEGIR
ncbi:MAG: FHA domain-containing protein [Pseudobdellovibrio sp.]|nr:FHA domain-containing protein [Pseudobdellovibrio sp.]